MKQLNARRSTTLLTLSSASNTAKSTTSGTSFSTGPTTGPTDAAHSRIAAAASSTFPITSVAWAPSCGRLIATGGRDGYGKSNLDRRTIMKVKTMAKWTAVSVADFDQHKSAVGRVEWNITATIPSSVGNDGRMWKATSGHVWRPAGSVGVEQAEEPTEPEHKDVEMDA